MEGPRLSGIGMTSARTRERLVQRLREQGITDQRVLDRIRNVPRHLFVDEALATRAYEDTALPIGFGQTISQPYVVARMTEALARGGTGATRCSRSAPAAAIRRRCSRRWSRRSTPSSASRACSRARAALAARAQDPQRALPSRRRQRRLAGARALRRHSVDGGPARRAAGALRAAQSRRPPDRARWARTGARNSCATPRVKRGCSASRWAP